MADAVESGIDGHLARGVALASDSCALGGYESGDEGDDIETSGREPSASPDAVGLDGNRDETVRQPTVDPQCSEDAGRDRTDESTNELAGHAYFEESNVRIPPVGPDSAYLGDVETSGDGYSSRADTSEPASQMPVAFQSREWYQIMRGERPPESLMTSAQGTPPTNHVRRKVAMGLHVCSRFRRHGAISPVQAAVLKDLILGEDERVTELLRQLETGTHRHDATKELLTIARTLS